MKKLVVLAWVLTGMTCTLTAQNVEGRKGLTEDQAGARQSIVEKYDDDGDGVLSRRERRALSKDEKRTLAKSGGVGTAGKAPKVREGKPKVKGDHRPEAPSDAAPKPPARPPKASSGGKGKGGKK